jgi:hypothetical protein
MSAPPAVRTRSIAIAAAVGAAALSANGCVSLAATGGAHVSVSGAPTRVVSGSLLFGGWYAIKDRYVLELNMGYELGPMGEKSNALFMAGLRFATPSHGWRPGYYGIALVGAPFPNDYQNWEAGPMGGAFRGGAGVAWTSFSRERGDFGPHGYASVMLGLALHHQDQDSIGTGTFLGVELTLVGGANAVEAFREDAD